MACYEKDCHYVMTHDGGCFYEGLPMDRKENCPMYKAKTNADSIRAMTDEEIADFLCDIGECDRRCPAKIGDCFFSDSSCRSAWLDWLKEEAKDDRV